MRKALISLFSLCLAVSAGAQDPDFHIFLCFGQSNMEGAARPEHVDSVGISDRYLTLAAVDYQDSSRVMGQWYKALPPLCRYGNGMSPADYFGRTMLEILYAEAPEIDAELDTYWVQKGGADPVRWIETLAGRQQVLHLKDYGMKPFCECGDSVMMPVGEGNLDWKRILDAAGRAGVTCWVVEHDGDTSDPFGSFASSIRFLKENFSR